MRFGKPAAEVTEKEKKFHLVQLGKSGAGKTTRTLTATQFGPLLVLDFDGKFQGASRKIPAAIKGEVDLSKVDVENCRDKTYEEVLQLVDSIVEASKKGEFKYATVCIDTFTNFSTCVYSSIFKSEEDLFKSNTMQQWGRVGHRTVALITKLQTLPCNLIVNCHVKEDENGHPIGPEGKGNMARQSLQPNMSDVQYLVFERGKYKVKLTNSSIPPVNTTLPADVIDSSGFAKEFGLKIFKGFAYTAEMSDSGQDKK